MTRREYQAIVTCVTIALSFGLSARRAADFLERYEASTSFRLLGKGGERMAYAWLMDSKYLDRADDVLALARRAAIAGFITAVLMGMNLPEEMPCEELEYWAGKLVHAARRIESANPVAVVWSWYFKMIDDSVDGCSFFTSDLEPEHHYSLMIEGAAGLLQHPALEHADLKGSASVLKNEAQFAPRAVGYALNATADLLESLSIFLQIQDMQKMPERKIIAEQILAVKNLTQSAIQEIAKAAAAWHMEQLQQKEQLVSLPILQEQQSEAYKDMAGMFCKVMLRHKLPQRFGIAGAG